MRIDFNSDEFVSINHFIEKLAGDYSAKLLSDESFVKTFNSIFEHTGLKRANILDVMSLDGKEVYDEYFYKLWKISNSNTDMYLTTLSFLREFFEKDEVLKNLSLDSPVPFITFPLFYGNKEIINASSFYKIINNNLDREKFEFIIRKSFVERYNAQLQKENKDSSLMIPEEKLILFEQNEKIPDGYLIDAKNVYFGTSTIDFSGGVVGLNMKFVSWFEKKEYYLNINNIEHCIFKNITFNEDIILDETGKIYIPPENITVNNYSIFPTSKTRYVYAVSLLELTNNIFNKNEEDYFNGLISNSHYVEKKNNILNLQLLLNTSKISYKHLKELEPIIRDLYEQTYGSLFLDSDLKNRK